MVGDVRAARQAVREAERLLDKYPVGGLLGARLDAARTGVAVLSPAELRVLHLLPTHLTSGEIADHLFVSRNTVKSQAIAVYRKFGVSSRAAAVEHATMVGIL
jgi:LuxR family maltose regulon positive regulatory protein